MDGLIYNVTQQVEALARSSSRRTDVITARDRVFIVGHDGTREEVTPLHEDRRARRGATDIGDITSLIAWAKDYGDEVGDVLIARHQSARTVAKTPRLRAPEVQADEARVPFYDAALPPRTVMSWQVFLEWLDIIRPGVAIDMMGVLDAAMSSLKVTDGKVSSITVDGAMIRVSSQTERQVTGEQKVPKRFTATIPYGDPSCRLEVEFAILASVDDGAIRFSARPLDPARLQLEWTAWARSLLAEALPGWTILVGA